MKHTDLRNLLIFSVAILLGMALAACGGGKYHGELLRAEAILDSLPDSAREILKTIPRNTIDTREDLALRDLIAAEVQYKLYEDSPTGADTLAAAEETFRTNGDNKRLMRTLFQKAVRQLYADDYSESLVAGLQALEIAEKLQDYKYLGYTNRHLCNIYNNCYYFSEALSYGRNAMSYFRKAGMEEHAFFAWASTIKDLYNLGHYEQALLTADSVIAEAGYTNNVLLSYVYESRIRPNLKLERFKDAKLSRDSMIFYDGDADYHNPMLPVLVTIKSGELDLARRQIDSLKVCEGSSITPMDISNLEYEYRMAIGDTATALALFDKTSRLEIDSLIKIARHGINDSQSDNYRLVSESIISRATIQKHFRTICSLLAVVLLLIIVLLILWKRRQKNANILRQKEDKISKLAFELDSIQKVLNEKDSRIENLTTLLSNSERSNSEESGTLLEDLRNLFNSQFQTINSLCKDYYSKKDANSKVRMSLINDIEINIKALNSNGNLKEIERVLDKYYNGVATKLKQAVPDLRSRDRIMLLLSMTALSTKAICIICDLKDSGYYYSRRQQLKDKIADSGSPYAQEIIAMLS